MTAGTGLNVGAGPGGSITTTGTLNINVGTGANQIVQLNGSSQIPAIDGSLLTNLTPANLSGAVPINKGGTGQTAKTAAFDALSPLTTKGDVVTSDGTNNVRLPAGADYKYLRANSATGTGLEYSDVTAVDLASLSTTGIVQRTGAGAYSTLGVTAPIINSGTNIGLSIGTGLTTSSGNLVVNVGTGANQIPQLDGSGKLDPAVVSSAAVTQYGTAAATANTLVLRDASADFATHNITANQINTTETYATDLYIRNASNKTMKFNLDPAVSTNFSLVWPDNTGSAGKILSNDGSGNLSWIAAGAGGSVTSVIAGTGLNVGAGPGGTISTTGTLNIDVGTGANQIVQLTAASKLPAVDGSLLTNMTWAQITSGKPTTLSGYGITDSVQNLAGTPAMQTGLDASKPASPSAGTVYFATDTNKIWQYNSGAWATIASASGSGGTITALTSDVSASGSGSVAATVNSVGTSTAANIHSAELLANAATNLNTASTIVKRDASGNFTAGTITADLTGNVTGNVTGSASLNLLKAGDSMTGMLTLATGTTTLSPLRIPSGVLVTTPVSGNIESDGSSLYWTSGTPTRQKLAAYTGTPANGQLLIEMEADLV